MSSLIPFGDAAINVELTNQSISGNTDILTLSDVTPHQ
jgi:hypothetical protein